MVVCVLCACVCVRMRACPEGHVHRAVPNFVEIGYMVMEI